MDKYTFTDRTKVPLSKKLNPIWWFGNDAEQTVDDAPWYMPHSPEFVRRLFWNFRNPLQNLRSFVLGVQDRNYTVIGRAPVLTVQRDDIQPRDGSKWQWCLILLPIPLPFVSYSGKKVLWYFGWQPTGFFGAKFNVH